MNNRITKQPLSVTLVLCSLLAVLFWFRHLFYPLAAEAPVANLMPFGGAIARWLDGMPMLEALLSLLAVYLTVISLTRLISRNIVFSARTYVYLVFFIIAGYGLCIRTGNLPAVLAAYLTARASECFSSAFRRTARMGDSFRGAFLLGLAPLFYAPAAVYLLLVPIAMPVYMRGWRETAVAFAGLLLPMFAYSYVTWAAGEPFLKLYTDVIATLGTSAPASGLFDIASPVGILRLSTAVLLAAAAVISLVAFFGAARQIRTRAYRIYLYMLMFMLLAVGTMLLPCASPGDLPLTAVPLSVVGTFFFSRFEGRFAAIFYTLTIVCAIAYNLSVIVV